MVYFINDIESFMVFIFANLLHYRISFDKNEKAQKHNGVDDDL